MLSDFMFLTCSWMEEPIIMGDFLEAKLCGTCSIWPMCSNDL